MTIDASLKPPEILAVAVRSEIDLLEKFPEYFDVEDFHIGQDLFHVGP